MHLSVSISLLPMSAAGAAYAESTSAGLPQGQALAVSAAVGAGASGLLAGWRRWRERRHEWDWYETDNGPDEQAHGCPECRRSFKTPDALGQHVLAKHPAAETEVIA